MCSKAEYLQKTKRKFESKAPLKNRLNAFELVEGYYRILKFEIKEENHIKHADIPYQVVVSANWKESDQDEYLSEMVFEFDLTPLLYDLKDFNNNLIQGDFGKKLAILKVVSQYYDFWFKSTNHSLESTSVLKKNSLIVINNIEGKNKIIHNEKLYPLYNNTEENNESSGNTIYALKGSNQDYLDQFFPGYRVVEIESNNIQDAFNNEWLPENYFMSLDFVRNDLNLTMAETVPVPGHYMIHTLRIDKAREDKNGNAYGYDAPYQIIGIGKWMPLQSDSPMGPVFDMQSKFDFEIRLNPLLNVNAEIQELHHSFSREKNWRSFYHLAQNFSFKINHIRFGDTSRSYIINWKPMIIAHKVDNMDVEITSN